MIATLDPFVNESRVAKILSFVKVLLKGVFRVNAVLQKYLAKGELFARIFAKPYRDEDRLRTRFDL